MQSTVSISLCTNSASLDAEVQMDSTKFVEPSWQNVGAEVGVKEIKCFQFCPDNLDHFGTYPDFQSTTFSFILYYHVMTGPSYFRVAALPFYVPIWMECVVTLVQEHYSMGVASSHQWRNPHRAGKERKNKTQINKCSCNVSIIFFFSQYGIQFWFLFYFILIRFRLR